MNFDSEFVENLVLVVVFFLGLIPLVLLRDSWRHRDDGSIRWVQMAAYVVAILGSLVSGFVFFQNVL